MLLRFYYLGWDFHGFVKQEDTTNTVENYLFHALIKTCLIKDRESSNYHRCGRTDKGVSSYGQVFKYIFNYYKIFFIGNIHRFTE